MSSLSVQPSERITFSLEYQDEDVLVVNKRSGLATQPGLGHEDDTLLNGLFARYGHQLQNLGAARDFGLLHRLDKATSGLLIIALRNRAYDDLRRQFEQRLIGKFYWAICSKAPKHAVGVVNKPLLEVEPRPGKFGEKKTCIVSGRGKPSATAYRTLSSSIHGALLEARPLTGRLHQVRVHFEAIGCPILGDTMYAPEGVAHAAPRLALHSHRVTFTHPTSGQQMDVRSAMPKELRATLLKLKLTLPDIATDAAGPAVRASSPGAR
jgi:23S rRNA pseudouridine1911/1915/1917 synthase